MKVYAIVILALIKIGASEVDEELEEKFRTLSRSDFVEHFNENNYSWKIKQYPDLVFSWDQTSSYEDHQSYISRLQPIYHDRNKVGPIPVNFDSRDHWRFCESIREISDQKGCNSCWTHGVANTASDRTCIHANKNVYLSEQDLECAHENGTICSSGSSNAGFTFWKKKGLVTRQCKPYQPWALNRRGCDRTCVNPHQSYEQDKYYAQKIYYLHNEDFQIRAEIYLNGPVSATFQVYQDFTDWGYSYHKGIYVHTHGNASGFHIVRVIGYGVENGVDYWLAANSWSRKWGEDGVFKIKRFQNDNYFEDMMLAGIPKLVDKTNTN